jgi:hypothetical protein
MNEINIYITEDGRELRIPPEIMRATVFTKAGLPDKRKPNAEFHAWLEEAMAEPHSNGDTSREPENVLPVKGHDGVACVTADPRPVVNAEAVEYALRVWRGQTPDLPRAERIRRVKAALEAQGMSMEGVEL